MLVYSSQVTFRNVCRPKYSEQEAVAAVTETENVLADFKICP